MSFRLSRRQMQGPPMSDVAFAEWFVDEIMPEMHPIPRRELMRVECLRNTKSARAYLKHFGFEVTSDQGQVMSLFWLLGPNLFEIEPFKAIFEDRETPAETRVNALWDADDAAWHRAEVNCDDRYWHPRLVFGNVLGLKAYSDMTKEELDAPIDEAETDPWSQFHDND